jgi:hypothetical protein
MECHMKENKLNYFHCLFYCELCSFSSLTLEGSSIVGHTWASWAKPHGPNTHKLQHPPQSELPAQRSYRLDTRKEVQTHTSSPPQSQLATGDVEAGAKLSEGRGREALGEDVGKLGGGRDVEDPNIANGDTITDKV